MATVSATAFDDERLDFTNVVLCVPPEAHTFAGFRKWVWSDEFPEQVRVSFIHGNVYLDVSKQSLQTHLAVKSGLYETLLPLMKSEDLGEFYTDGVLISNEAAELFNNPDGAAVLWETIQSERVRFLGNKRAELEIEGSPDWVMEVVSDGSVGKDTKQLRKTYHRAHISEYWLIDARGSEIVFQILHWRKAAYVAAPNKDGWQFSKVFGRYFQLTRERNRRGAWTYTLLVRSAE